MNRDLHARRDDRRWPRNRDAGDAAQVDDPMRRIGRAAVVALYDELSLTPKPGLVSFADNGSHEDMDAHTFLRSICALRAYFSDITQLGASGVPFGCLEQRGRLAELSMSEATGGVNTHRGAIFALGLLCAAAGWVSAEGGGLMPGRIQMTLRRRWGNALSARTRCISNLPGGMASATYQLRGASVEAAEGFPVLFDVAIPAWEAATASGLSYRDVRLNTFFAIMANLDDSNLARRGGREGLDFARTAARQFMQAGGSAADKGLARATAIHHAFVARRLSPGGCADMLAAASLLMRIRPDRCVMR